MAAARRFTPGEADALLETLVPLLERLRAETMRMVSSRHQVRERVPTNGGGGSGKEMLESSDESERLLRSIHDLGVLVRDAGTGLVDFPAERDGREVYLCWRLGEARVEWWHPVDTGVAGRRRLEDR